MTATAPVLKITSAKEWRALRQEGVLIELPSGMTARLRPVSLIDLWAAGQIPDGLTTLVSELLTKGQVTEMVEAGQKSLDALVKLYTIVAKSAFLTPAVVDKARDNAEEIEIGDLTTEDREFVLRFANSPSAELRSFRNGK